IRQRPHRVWNCGLGDSKRLGRTVKLLQQADPHGRRVRSVWIGRCDMRQRFERRLGLVIRGEHVGGDQRSEEHTSELQSLMRISYSVFFFKKKNISSSLS